MNAPEENGTMAPSYTINNITYTALGDPVRTYCKCHPSSITYTAVCADDLNNKVLLNWNFSDLGPNFPKEKYPWNEKSRINVHLYEVPEEDVWLPRGLRL